MKVPYDGKVNMRLVAKRFKNKVFYYVSDFDNYKYSFKPCALSKRSSESFVLINFFNYEMKLDTSCSSHFYWERLFDSFEDAEEEVKRINSLYFDGFYKKPYLSTSILESHKEDLLKIEEDINKLLMGFENFLGIDFCNVSAGGIHIRGHHKQIQGYTYGEQPKIKYDFSNKDDIVMEFVNMWFKHDTEDKVKGEQSFIADGEKYGWD